MPQLPLIPYTVITDGTEWTTDLANLAFYAPIRDGQTQYLGHTEKILDAELDDGVNSIKARVSAVTNGLAPSLSTGLTVAYSAGQVITPSGALVSIAASTVSVPANSTTFIWVDPSGTVQSGAQPPSIRRLIARVISGASGISTLQDLRQTGLHTVAPFAGSIKVFGGNSAIDKVCTQGEQLLAGEYYFRNFTVPSGVTITLSGYTRIICSGTFTVAGTITLQRSSKGGLGFRGTARANLVYPGFPGQGLGGGSGINQSANAVYNYFATQMSSGGSGSWSEIGGSVITPFLVTPRGGDGGGTLIVEAAADVTVTGSILADGEAGQGASNVTLNGNSYTPGAAASISGGGGGSGGLIWLKSLTAIVVSNVATLSVRGGNGGTGTDGAAMPGGGGGGGYVVTQAPSVNTTGANILLAGGSSSVPTGTIGSVPGASFAGAGGSAGQAGGIGQFISGGLVPY